MLKWKRLFFLICFVATLVMVVNGPRFLCVSTMRENSLAIAAQNSNYRWQNVAIGGGGFVTGIISHPTEPDLIYTRTDVGGAYRWNASDRRWIPLMEMFPLEESYVFGVESIAIDPSNPDIVYAATGFYADSRGRRNGVLLKSRDRGATWNSIDLSFKLGSNQEGRWNGERLVVDPNDSDILYLGSRNDGLWKSTNGGETWEPVSNFPQKGTSQRGISFVVFDPSTGTPGTLTQTIYVGVMGANVYRSDDGGKTWSSLSADNPKPQRAALANDGTLYVTFDEPGAIKKFKNNIWTDISPADLKSFNAISVDPKNPDLIVAAEWFFNHGNKIFQSTNGGESWQELNYKTENVPPWAENNGRSPWASGIASLMFDPHHAHRVWYTDGWGIWRTNDIQKNPSIWENLVAGHEEIVNFALKSQPDSGALLQGSGDIGGMRHTHLQEYPQKVFQSPAWMANDFISIDAGETNSNFVVAVGSRRWKNRTYPDPGYALYSEDDGKTWTEFSSYPEGYRKAFRGRVAVSATQIGHLVWVPEGEEMTAYYSKDKGKTWQRSQGAPTGLTRSVWQWHQPLGSDRVNGNTFYLYQDGQLYKSTDGGETWAITARNLPNLNFDWENNAWSVLKAAPGMEGEVWISFNTMGLYRSSNGGNDFQRLENVQEARIFGFGKNPPNQSNPTVFVYGKVNNQSGIFRSDDLGKNWLRIDPPGQPIGKDPKTMVGDRKVFGRVYIGTGGRGIYYGEPSNLNASPNLVSQKSESSILSCGLQWMQSLFAAIS